MLRYADFAPRFAKSSGLWNQMVGAGEFESFDAAVEAANRWIVTNSVKVVSVETVVLPNIWAEREEGTKDASLATNETNFAVNRWHQFVRVWYEG
jgi:hypothetical protein